MSMKILYLGAAWMEKLEESFRFDRPLPFVNRQYPFGTNLAVRLARAGHHVSIATFSLSARGIEKYTSAECDVYIVHCRRTRYQLATLYCREVAALRRVVDMVRPDVILANWTYQFARAGVTSGYPCLVIARDSPWRCLWQIRSFSFAIKAFYSQLFVFPKIRHLVTISPHMVEDLRRLNGYKSEIAVIPNGIAMDDGGCGKAIVDKARTIVCVSEWGRLKNSKSLFRAFAILHRRHPDWRLVAIGHYIDAMGAGAWMANAGVCHEGMELRGLQTQAQIRDCLASEADVFCSPTLEESFGMVFLEAMAQGVPCVGGEKSGAVPWLMGEGGVTCDVTKPERLAECLEKVMLDWELRKRLSAAGAERARTEFAMEKCIGRYEEALRRVAEGGE